MNIDEAKLTAFALNELDEPERSTIALELAASPDAQRFVNQTRDLAHALTSAFAAEAQGHGRAPAAISASANLIDIRDEPWFWSRARPLAIAAAIAVLAILAAVTFSTYRPRDNSIAAVSTGTTTEIQGEETPLTETATEFAGPESIRNPLRSDTIGRIDRVVVGELDPHLENGEIRMIETINDIYRIQHLKQRLAAPTLSKKSHRTFVGGGYQLLFLDTDGRVIATAAFYRSPDLGFVLQPSKEAYIRSGHYFIGVGDNVLPGDWQSAVDYSKYVIPFSDWDEAIGYSPRA